MAGADRRRRSSTCRSRCRGASRCATAPASFDDHFSQARLFWPSMTPVEQDHIIAGLHLRAGQVLRAGDQGAAAAACWPTSTPTCARRSPRAWACPRPSRRWPLADVDAEPGPVPGRRHWPTDGRVIGIVADDVQRPGRGDRPAERDRGGRHGGAGHRPHGGTLTAGDGRPGHRAAHPADDPVDRVRRRRGGGLAHAGAEDVPAAGGGVPARQGHRRLGRRRGGPGRGRLPDRRPRRGGRAGRHADAGAGAWSCSPSTACGTVSRSR